MELLAKTLNIKFFALSCKQMTVARVEDDTIYCIYENTMKKKNENEKGQ